MTDLSPVGEDEWAAARRAARAFSTAKLRDLIDVLAPYVDGSMGAEVSPSHVKLYLQAIKDMGVLYQLAQPPVLAVEAETDVAALEAPVLRRRALESLAVLEERARSRNGLG